MPRGKQIEIKSKAKSKRVLVSRAKKPEINHEEIERIKAMLAAEEGAIEADMRKEMSRMIDERDVQMSRQLGDMNAKNKRLIMWIGVSLIMLMIVIFWVSTLDLAVNRSYAKSDKQIDKKSLSEYKDNLDKTFKEVMTQIDKLKEQSQTLSTSSEPSLASTTSDNSQQSVPAENSPEGHLPQTDNSN